MRVLRGRRAAAAGCHAAAVRATLHEQPGLPLNDWQHHRHPGVHGRLRDSDGVRVGCAATAAAAAVAAAAASRIDVQPQHRGKAVQRRGGVPQAELHRAIPPPRQQHQALRHLCAEQPGGSAAASCAAAAAVGHVPGPRLFPRTLRRKEAGTGCRAATDATEHGSSSNAEGPGREEVMQSGPINAAFQQVAVDADASTTTDAVTAAIGRPHTACGGATATAAVAGQPRRYGDVSEQRRQLNGRQHVPAGEERGAVDALHQLRQR